MMNGIAPRQPGSDTISDTLIGGSHLYAKGVEQPRAHAELSLRPPEGHVKREPRDLDTRKIQGRRRSNKPGSSTTNAT